MKAVLHSGVTGITLALAAAAACVFPFSCSKPECAGAGVPENCRVVVFEDPEVETTVRLAAGVTGGPVCGQYLGSVTYLAIQGNEDMGVMSLSGIECMTGLTFLSISGRPVEDPDPIAGLTGLAELNIGGAELTTLQPLSSLTNLVALRLSENGLEDLRGLPVTPSLAVLHASRNPLTDISEIAGLEGLVELRIRETPLVDIGPLAGLPNLKNVSLVDNSIRDVSPLSSLPVLKFLSIGNNDIEDITPLGALQSPLDLYVAVSGNRITDLSPLGTQTLMVELVAEDNQTEEIGGIAHLGPMEQGSLLALFLVGNPLNQEALTIHIPRLCAAGVYVSYGDHEDRQSCAPSR